MKPRRKPQSDLPRPAIADVLVEIGASAAEIPTGYGWVRMRCPFHPDRTASASVNHDPETGGFICYANQNCPKGDAIKLLQTGLRLSWGEAVERASVLSGETGNRPSRSGRKPPKRRASDLLKGTR